jgi:putative hemolysin
LDSSGFAIILVFVTAILTAFYLGTQLQKRAKNKNGDFESFSKPSIELPVEATHVIPPEEQNVLDDRERGMIRSIINLDSYDVRNIMAPRVDIIAVEIQDSLEDVATQMLDSGHSQLPVYINTIDKVVGVIHARDLLPLLNTDRPWPTLDKMYRAPFFVPETKRLDELLTEFQKTRIQMALVIDEHGGTEGLVTLEDLLEEIVGEIEDEFSTVIDHELTLADNGTMTVDARTSLNDIENLLGIDFTGVEVDTVGGLVYTVLDKIPKTGDEVTCHGLHIRVLSTVGRRLRKLRLTINIPSNTQ